MRRRDSLAGKAGFLAGIRLYSDGIEAGGEERACVSPANAIAVMLTYEAVVDPLEVGIAIAPIARR